MQNWMQRFKHPIALPLLLVLILALLTFWINQNVQENALLRIGHNRHDPDYVVHNFVSSQTDAQGNMKFVLAAVELKHFPDADTSELQRPRFTQFGQNKPYTQMHSSRGYVSPDAEVIEMVDNVRVIRQATATKGEMELQTDKMTIEPDKEVASTQSEVTILQKPGTVVKAKGMIFDKNSNTIQLFNRVRVHYERPPKITGAE